MGDINLLAVLLGALAFFAVGMVWYGVLFGRVWKREAGLTPELTKERIAGGNMPLILGLCFLFELLIALTLGHQFARSDPSTRGMMMISIGYALGIMIPAIGINYLLQRRSGKLFAIDAGHLLFGMAAMGAVFVWFR